MKFDTNLPGSFRGDGFEDVDGQRRLPSYKLPRFRGAKN